MTNSLKGGCLCGATCYTYKGPIGPSSYCHCEDCRRCTGSAFNVSVRVEVMKFEILSEPLSGFTTVSEAGNKLTRHFCSNCGSPIYTSSDKHPDYYYVKAGSFNDPDIVKPGYQSWTSSAVEWATIKSDLLCFEKGR